MPKRRPLLTATPSQRNMLAIDLAPRDTPLDLLKRAAILRTALIDVACVGKDAALVKPQLLRVKTRRRTLAQLAATRRATFSAKRAAEVRRSA